MKIIKLMTTILVSIAVAACGGGGGGGSTTPPPAAVKISGMAAGGAPIIGAVVAKDSKGTSFGPATIAANGSYSLDVTNGVAPFILQASGVVGTTNIEVYSVANDPALNLNVNPLTNMVVAQATGSSPAAVFTNCASASCGTPAKANVDLGQQQVQALLQTLLTQFGVTGTINLLNDAIVAGPVATQSPIDKMMDVVNIQPVVGAPSSFEIKPNPISGLPTTTVLVTIPAPPAGGVTTVTTTALPVEASLTPTVITNATAAVTSLQAIQSQFTVLTGLYATARPAATDPALVALFDTNWLDWGKNVTTQLASMTGANGPPAGSKWSNVVAAAPRAAPAIQVANDATHQWFTMVFTAPSGYTEKNGPILATKIGSTWVFSGNQMPTPSFDGSYRSVTVMTGGWVHREANTVTGTTVSISHKFVNTDPLITGTGTFVCSACTLTPSATDNRAGTISGTVTITNGTVRTAALTGGVYIQNDGSIKMWWTATDPGDANMAASGIGGGSATPPPAIVGTWNMPFYPAVGTAPAAPAFVSMVLLKDGRFMFLGENGAGQCQAMESGIYTYDSATTNLVFTVTYDTDSTCGLLHNTTLPTVTSPALITYTFATGGTTTGTLSSAAGTWGAFNKLPSATATTSVGTWLFAPIATNDFNLVINYADGRFMIAQAPSLAFPSIAANTVGLETGTYTSNNTSNFTFATISYDGNGTAGIGALAGVLLGMTVTDVNHIIVDPTAAATGLTHPAVRQ